MSLKLDQGLKMVRAAMVLSLLSMVALPVCAEEKQNAMSEKGRSERIRELQREQAHIESELPSSARSRKGQRDLRFRALNFRVSRQEA